MTARDTGYPPVTAPRVPPLASVAESWLLVAIAYLAIADVVMWALA